MHSLAKIAVETRTKHVELLSIEAEGNLERLIRQQASNNPHLTPSGYRLISGLIARPWCLCEISKANEIIQLVADTTIEINESVMEARCKCCKAVLESIKFTLQTYYDIVAKLEEATKK